MKDKIFQNLGFENKSISSQNKDIVVPEADKSRDTVTMYKDIEMCNNTLQKNLFTSFMIL